MCTYENVIFDFDSTLIAFESLELVMADLLQGDQHKIQQLEILTNAGMNGEIGFRESLEARLSIVKPSCQALHAFVAQYCPGAFTIGVEKLIQKLHANGVKVWIISGGFRELILPFAQVLNIPSAQVCAVNLNWNENGQFESLNNDNGFCDSKVMGVQRIREQLQGQTLIVGDGFTDYELFREGIAHQFIAYTEHVSRQQVLDVAPFYAQNITELSNLIYPENPRF
ncbi:HAD-IB family phosphatase [Caedibacter taeniospiralis]|uniref:HAD-IB family phosphatase n=1 Tax=Caedibacter taeniospiralis TaxID=28907 RepID=UPI000C276BB9|nr:HAD-IB family phosphatase [Caedibacter taeniospiralis]